MGPIQKQWVAALRSGKYKQGRHKLQTIVHGEPRYAPRYCCLGVGAMITDQLHVNDLYLNFPGRLGLKTNCGQFETEVDDRYTTLSAMNDSGKYTFEQIADIIEEKEHELFDKEV